MNLKTNWLIYLLIIIGFCILYLKPDKEVKIEQKEYDKKHDSVFVNIGKSEVKQFKTIQNINNLIQTNNEKKFWYTQNDSLKLIAIDSLLKSSGYR